MLFLALGACGDDSGGGGGGGGVDAPPVSTSVTVTGTASEVTTSGRMPVAGVTVTAFKEGDPSVVAMATTDASGNYTITITTDGTALDGYLLGKHTGYKDTYLYPPRPLSADLANASILLLTQQTFDAAAAIGQAQQTAGMGWIGIQIFDSANMPVEGVTVTSTPAGTVRYNASNGLPSRTPTSTAADGIAYIFNVAPGTVTVSASGGTGNLTYHSHPVNARADQITTTLIQP